MSDQVQELVDRAIVREVSDNGEEPDGYHSVGVVEVPLDDTEALAKAEELIAKARDARRQKCTDAVNKVLEDHNCQLQIAVKVGEQTMLLGQVLNLPAQALITSK